MFTIIFHIKHPLNYTKVRPSRLQILFVTAYVCIYTRRPKMMSVVYNVFLVLKGIFLCLYVWKFDLGLNCTLKDKYQFI